MMFDQIEKALCLSGNSQRLDVPVHMDAAGNPGDNESLAVGYPVTIETIRRNNVFFMDETGDNTHGKKDGRRGGEKFVVGKGQGANNIVGTNDCHFTVVPITNMNGHLVMVTVIFKGKKLIESWCLGIDVFSVFDESNYENNFGTGKRYPGLQLYRDNGTKIPICWAASPNACMSGEILTLMFVQMDKLGISRRGIDDIGKPFYPA
jgi:hypothetical protein